MLGFFPEDGGWGSGVGNISRGCTLAIPGPVNRGSMPIYRQPGFGGSIPDNVLVSVDLFPLVAKCVLC